MELTIEKFLKSEEFAFVMEAMNKRIKESNEINLFRMFDKYISENILSDFLALLFESNYRHGLGKELVKEVFFFCKNDILEKSGNTIDIINCHSTSVVTEWIVPGIRKRRIDILLQCLDENNVLSAVIGIEHKIDAKEQEKQVSDYQKALTIAFPDMPIMMLFLTRDGRVSETKDSNSICPQFDMGYFDLARIIEKILSSQHLQDELFILLKSFKNYLLFLSKKPNMDNQILQKIRNIYLDETQREAIKLIYENFPRISEVFESARIYIKIQSGENIDNLEIYRQYELKMRLADNDELDYSLHLMLHSYEDNPTIGTHFSLRLMIWTDDEEQRIILRDNKTKIYSEFPTNMLQDWSCWINLWSGIGVTINDMGDLDATSMGRLMLEKRKMLIDRIPEIKKRINELIEQHHNS